MIKPGDIKVQNITYGFLKILESIKNKPLIEGINQVKRFIEKIR